MKNLKRNKGAALVAVLIGILFIAILASSLLYMTTMNYKMKSMRQFSSSTFYTAELGLSDMMSQLKQYCMSKTDPQGELKTFLNGGGGKFNKTNLNNLVQHLVNDDIIDGIESIEVHSVYDGTGVATYIEDGNYIRLKGVTITATTDAAHGSYVSSVTTDIDFGFPPVPSNNGKLNDFSILSDSPMDVQASSQYIGGDLYLFANGALGTDALRVGNSAVVTILSRYAFLQGDLTVNGHGAVYISGTCIVDGSVKVSEHGQIIVGGNLIVKDGISGRCDTSGSGTMSAYDTSIDWGYYATNYPHGLANKLVAEKMYVHVPSGDHELTQQEFKTQMNAGTNDTGLQQTGTVDGITCSAWYCTNKVDHNIENTLLISPVAIGSFHGTCLNSTYLCVCPDATISIGEGGGTQPISNCWGTMDDATYEAALKLMFRANWPNNWGGQQPAFSPEGYSTNDIVDAGPGSPYPDRKVINGINIRPFRDGYYYNEANEKQNFFPYSKFLSDDINTIIGEFKGGTESGGGGAITTSAQPTVFISNWTKN